jgi:hypothetical protein
VVRNAADSTLSVFYGVPFVGPRIGPLSGTALVAPQFSVPVTIPVGLGVSDVQAVDTTGSGRLDLVVTNNLTAQMTILRNLGGGTFAPPAPYSRAGTGLSAVDHARSPEVMSLDATAGVAAGSFTTGGPRDLVTINPGSETLDVLAGLGGGRFANPVAIQTHGPARVVRVADFTGNSIDDLAVLTATGLSIYLGDGRGGFLPPTTYAVPPESSGLSVADLTGDGRLDLLVGDDYGDVLVLLGNGDGTFQPYHEADQGIELAVADLTGNGSKDVIFADQGLDRVVVHYGAGSSTVLGDRSSGLLSPGAVTLADLNGDGIPDLIVANSGSNNVLVYPGLGDGQFGPATNGGHGYFVGTNPTGIAVANLNGQPDLIVANSGSNDVSILLGQGKGSNFTLVPGPRIKTDAGPVAVAAGDILGTGKTDLAVANGQANDVQVFPGIGGGFFGQTPTTYAVGQAPSGLFLGNFDGSGTGIATLNAGSDTISLIGRDGVVQTIATGGLRPSSGFAGDFTGSGFSDLVVGNSGDGRLSLLTGGPGGLSLSQEIASAAVPSPTALSFAGVTDGVLSFYAATAGREAASLLTFDLGAQGGAAGVVPGAGLAAGTGQSVGSVLAAATVGAFQQAAQLLGLRGSALDLIAPLLTVSVIPGEPGGAQLEGEVALLANFLPSTGAAVAQRLAFPHPEGASGGGAVEEAKGKPEAREAPEAELPPWAQFAVGLERAWEELRVEMLRRLGIDPRAAGQAVSAPGRESPAPVQAPGVPDRQGRAQPLPGRSKTGLTPGDEPTLKDSPPTRRTTLDVVGAAIADLAGGPFSGSRHGNRSSDRTREVLVVGDRLALPVAAAATLASAEGLARSIGSRRFPLRRRPRTMSGRPMFTR